MSFSSLPGVRLLLSVAIFLPLVGHAAQHTLTLAEAQRLAVERSRQLLAQDASIRSSQR